MNRLIQLQFADIDANRFRNAGQQTFDGQGVDRLHQNAACRQAGWKGPLNRCSVYGDKAVGAKFQKMLAMGQSRPWQDALETLTGSRQMDATAIIDYFAPLSAWLDQQLAGKQVGW